MILRIQRAAFAAAFSAPPLMAQGAVFQTPGMPQMPATYASSQGTPADSGQANRFSSVFNPAFSFVVDTLGDYTGNSGTSDDGVELQLRSLELAAQAWVDPDAWGYFVAASDGESLDVEEAALHYVGLGGHNTIRAGKFFIDFGKQMQTHVHELRTIDRPLVLRTYLGEEVKGVGLQWDDWTTFGDKTAVRWSLGVFNDLLPETESDFDPSTDVSQSISERKSIEDLDFTARLTGFTDVGENGVFQVGASARLLPSYAFEFAPSGSVEHNLSNTVFGLDATYGLTDETGQKNWTFGAEYLIDAGDTIANLDDAGTPADPTDDVVSSSSKTLNGFLVYGDYAWSRYNSVGLQFSLAEVPEPGTPNDSETTAYFTHLFSEFQRLRFEVSALDRDQGEDAMRFAIQYTAFVGAHGHGVNW
jgi:hypothetical protein